MLKALKNAEVLSEVFFFVLQRSQSLYELIQFPLTKRFCSYVTKTRHHDLLCITAGMGIFFRSNAYADINCNNCSVFLKVDRIL
jgi:hypothetical protein